MKKPFWVYFELSIRELIVLGIALNTPINTNFNERGVLSVVFLSDDDHYENLINELTSIIKMTFDEAIQYYNFYEEK